MKYALIPVLAKVKELVERVEEDRETLDLCYSHNCTDLILEIYYANEGKKHE